MPSSKGSVTSLQRLLLGAILAAAAVSAWYGLGRQGLMTWDEGVYFDEARFVVQAAKALRTGGSIAEATSGFAPRMGRPLNVGLNTVAMAVLGIHPWVPAALAGLFGLLCVYMTFVLGRRLFGPQVGLLAALLLTISPYFLQYRRMGLPEVAGALAALLILNRLLVLREGEERRPGLNSLALGLMMGMAFTINMRLGVLLALAFAFRLLWLLPAVRARGLFGHALLLGAGIVAVMGLFEAPYRLISLVMTTPVPLETYLAQLARFVRTQDSMGRPPLHLAYLAPVVYVLYFETPAFLLDLLGMRATGNPTGTAGVPARPGDAPGTVSRPPGSPTTGTAAVPARDPGVGLLVACLLAQFLALGLVMPFARYLSWVLPPLMILAAYGLSRLRRPLALVLLVLVMGNGAYRGVPMWQAHGQMASAADWLHAHAASAIVTSDMSLALAHTDLPLLQIPDAPAAAAAAIQAAAAPGPCYVLLDRQQFMAGTFVMSPQQHAQTAAGRIFRLARPAWQDRQFSGLFLPFCFEHNRDIVQTVRTGHELSRQSEVIAIYEATAALQALK